MTSQINILVTPSFTDKQKQQLCSALPDAHFTFALQDEVTEEMLSVANIILGNLKDPKQLKHCRNLKWIQLNNAGTEGYCEPGLLPENALLCNATGAYGMSISEHMIAVLFALKRKLNQYYTNQKHHLWQFEGHVSSVEGSTVLIIGLGNIGSTFGRKMYALGCRVLGIKRRVPSPSEDYHLPEWLSGLYTPDHLDELLPQADIVALCLPGYAQTYHILSRERIALLSRNSIVINIGRGTAIDTDALTRALQTGAIAGAALDVTDPEPLPSDHPLWDAPNTIITPHVSGKYAQPETLELIVSLFNENLKRYAKGETLQQIVDPETGYCI